MLPIAEARACGQIKKSNPLPKILPGAVAAQMVRCGKAGCKCSRGELHGPYFYRVGWQDGHRYKQYNRRSQLNGVRAACKAYRELQAKLRAGRAEYKRTLACARELFRMLSR